MFFVSGASSVFGPSYSDFRHQSHPSLVESPCAFMTNDARRETVTSAQLLVFVRYTRKLVLPVSVACVCVWSFCKKKDD